MEKFIEYVKQGVASFKLDSCCCIAPIKIGVLAIGYFNWLSALVCLIATANDSFSPTLKKVQEVLMEEASMSLCTLAYATELTFSVLLICAMHRDDVKLLKVYMYYGLASTFIAVIVYSGVIAAIDLLIKLVIIFTIVFQCYVILLVRSAIVEIKQRRNKNDDVYVYIKDKDQLIRHAVDIEAATDAGSSADRKHQHSELKVNETIEVKKEEINEHDNSKLNTQNEQTTTAIKDKPRKESEIKSKQQIETIIKIEKETPVVVKVEEENAETKTSDKDIKPIAQTKRGFIKRKIKNLKPNDINDEVQSETVTETKDKIEDEIETIEANTKDETQKTEDDSNAEKETERKYKRLGFFTRRKKQ